AWQLLTRQTLVQCVVRRLMPGRRVRRRTGHNCGRCARRGGTHNRRYSFSMQTGADLAAVFGQDQWDRQTYDALQPTAFIGSDSCDQFKAHVAQLEREVETSGDGKAAALKLGLCHQLLGRHRSSIDWLGKARSSGIRDFHLARSLRELGRYDDALSTF